jgi:hypothetical protein
MKKRTVTPASQGRILPATAMKRVGLASEVSFEGATVVSVMPALLSCLADGCN